MKGRISCVLVHPAFRSLAEEKESRRMARRDQFGGGKNQMCDVSKKLNKLIKQKEMVNYVEAC